VASGDIFDFCRPVLSQPYILFEVLIHLKGPRDRNPDFRPFQSILFHVASLHACLLILEILSVFTPLYAHSNLVEKVRCDFDPRQVPAADGARNHKNHGAVTFYTHARFHHDKTRTTKSPFTINFLVHISFNQLFASV
jgi:hypothetical protein